MADSLHSSNPTAARGTAPESDFIDFYQLLEAPTDATTTALRRRINELYSEAQSNRDHRNPTKRRRYEALCEILPYCRLVLLDPDKRARYDRYMEKSQAGQSVPDFEAMMDEIVGRIEDEDMGDERVGLLGVKGDDDYLPNASTMAALRGSGPSLAERPTAPVAQPTAAAPPPPQEAATSARVLKGENEGDEAVVLKGAGGKRRLSKEAASSLIGSIASVAVFFIAFPLTYRMMGSTNFSWVMGVLIGSLLGAAVWLLTHRKPRPSRQRVSQ